ncbi:uncharacterized protein LOC134819181 [Bolinopsis microptera]|uniref:uncharacterized protein LOC134819181 n=1 Tax=Bolinopsis microptera TaxID=2820187 RepID=UPI003079033E
MSDGRWRKRFLYTPHEKIMQAGYDLLRNEIGLTFKHGEVIFETSRDGFGIKRAYTLPPAPYNPSFIDKFSRDDDDLSKKEKTEKQRIDEFEAEVELFRHLETLEDVFVLNGFKYTHEQFDLFVSSHSSDGCKKKPQEEEGECDFIVIGGQYIAVFEVKSPDINSRNPEKMFYDRYKESLVQRNRTVRLIKGVFDYLGLENPPTVFSLSVFNRLSWKNVTQFKKFRQIDDHETQCNLLFKEDFEHFDDFWTRMLFSRKVAAISERGKDMIEKFKNIQKIIPILIGLWCTNNKNVGGESLASCILEIDHKLKTAAITRQPKGPFNREIKGSSPLFKKYLGIECLTQEQSDIFKCKQNYLCITGAPGSGKSVLLQGKMIELAKLVAGGGKPVVVIIFGQSALNQYEMVCKNAGIRYKSIHLTRKEEVPEVNSFSPDPAVVKRNWKLTFARIRNCLFENARDGEYEVTLLYSTTEKCFQEIKLYSDLLKVRVCKYLYHLLVDDAQLCFCYTVKEQTKECIEEFLAILKRRNRTDEVVDKLITWLSFDITQYFNNTIIPFDVLRHMGPTHPPPAMPERFEPHRSTIFHLLMNHFKGSLVHLSKNLRNTVEIFQLLYFLRQKICAGLLKSDYVLGNSCGHNIHGIKPTIYVLKGGVRELKICC